MEKKGEAKAESEGKQGMDEGERWGGRRKNGNKTGSEQGKMMQNNGANMRQRKEEGEYNKKAEGN